MPFKLKQLFLYFLLFNFIWIFSFGAAGITPVTYFADIFKDAASAGLEITTTISFFLYALSAYSFLWYSRKKKQQLAAFIFILLCIPVVMLCRYFLEEVVCPAFFGFHNYKPGTKLAYYMLDNRYFAIPYTAFGIVFYFIQSNHYKEFEKKELALHNQQAELEYLKSQINPHFLFNNLNSIYSLVYHKSDKALKAVEELSSLLRYMLYEKSGEVLLSEEVNYLNKFIALQKLRFDYELPVVIHIHTTGNEKIAPLLLIPLVENAFKHGDFKDSGSPLIITLIADNKQLMYSVENKKGDYEKDSHSGIGLINLKKRLQLIYPFRHTFQTEESATIFKTILTIKWQITVLPAL